MITWERVRYGSSTGGAYSHRGSVFGEKMYSIKNSRGRSCSCWELFWFNESHWRPIKGIDSGEATAIYSAAEVVAKLKEEAAEHLLSIVPGLKDCLGAFVQARQLERANRDQGSTTIKFAGGA